MKKLINRFISILLAVIISVSVLVVPLSSSAYDYYITFPEPSLDVKEKFVEDVDGNFKPAWFIVNCDGIYHIFNYNLDDFTDKFLSVSASDSKKNYFNCYDSLNNNFSLSDSVLMRYNSNNNSFSFTKQNLNYLYLYSYSSVSLSELKNNIIYSDLSVMCDGIEIFNPDIDNKSWYIENMIGCTVSGSDSSDDSLSWGTQYNNKNLTGFANWLISTGQINELIDYNINVSSDSILSFVNLWWNYKGSVSTFQKFAEIFNANSFERAKYCIDWFNDKWYEYNHTLWNVAGGEIVDIDVDKSNDLVVDSDSDDTITSLLRDILRRLINLPVTVSTAVYTAFLPFVDSVSDNLLGICNYLYNLPDNTANSIYNSFVDPINNIIAAINNSDGGGTVENITNNYYTYNTEVSDSEREEFDLMFTDYSQKYDELIRSKFPFIEQVSGIFDEVWAACGYSTSSTAELKTQTTMLYSSYGPNQTQQDFLNIKMSSIFSGYDANYLNSADVSNAPVFSVNIAGTECNIIDFRIFAKYRFIIQGIITFVFWIPYIWSLFKSVPGIIANVGDVYNHIISDEIRTIDYENSVLENEAIIESHQIHDLDEYDYFDYNFNDDTFTAYKTFDGWSKE